VPSRFSLVVLGSTSSRLDFDQCADPAQSMIVNSTSRRIAVVWVVSWSSPVILVGATPV
jgi:hypothetical protein